MDYNILERDIRQEDKMDWNRWFLQKLKEYNSSYKGIVAIAEKTGISERHLYRLKNGKEFTEPLRLKFAKAYSEIRTVFLQEIGFLS